MKLPMTVEFSDTDGRTYALVMLKAQQLMLLRHKPSQLSAA
jgi:hypothetical protein